LKKIIIFLLFIAFYSPIHSQVLGIGGQYVVESKGQFFINAALPTFTKHNPLHLFNLSGIEYTTRGTAKLSGLQLKPIQLSTYLSDKLFYESPFVVSLGIDAGYLFNFSKGYKNTLVITPNLYVDYKIFFIKTGYEFDAFHGHHQYFIRAGIGFALGTMKHFKAR